MARERLWSLLAHGQRVKRKCQSWLRIGKWHRSMPCVGREKRQMSRLRDESSAGCQRRGQRNIGNAKYKRARIRPMLANTWRKRRVKCRAEPTLMVNVMGMMTICRKPD